MDIVAANGGEIDCCSLAVLQNMGERTTSDGKSPPSARSFDGFVKKVRWVCKEWSISNSGYFDYSRETESGWDRFCKKVNTDPDYIFNQMKVIQVILTDGQPKARTWLEKMGFVSFDGFEGCGDKNDDSIWPGMNQNRPLVILLISTKNLKAYLDNYKESKVGAEEEDTECAA